ncbi:hypothetical protein PIB30_082328 [Stylosanthes scabra]|uniref:Uncharacterized protein n=1 Tax=Stylosanthes scabra TaxID=79078 RepID=A0ABU6TUT3_9FABA|nr:hypothetical protein [Stylosanthes scabra]
MAETTTPERNTSSSAEEMDVDVDTSKPEGGTEEVDKDKPSDDKATTDSEKPKVDDGKGKAKAEEQEEEKKKKKKKEKKKKKKEEEANKEIPTGPVKLGYKTFDSSVDIFDYFYNFLHSWPLNLNVNKYEHQMLLELLQKGHKDPAKKIGVGIKSFQVHNHPIWKGRCFAVIRENGSVDYFRFRKCVHRILPLPEDMLPQPGVDRHLRSKKKYARQGGVGRGGGSGSGM